MCIDFGYFLIFETTNWWSTCGCKKICTFLKNKKVFIMCEKKWQNPLLIFFRIFWERQFELALCKRHALKLKLALFNFSWKNGKSPITSFFSNWRFLSNFVDGQVGALKMCALLVAIKHFYLNVCGLRLSPILKNQGFHRWICGWHIWCRLMTPTNSCRKIPKISQVTRD